MALFLWSNLEVGASVVLTIHTGTSSHPLPSLFDFSLANSIRDMWSAKVYPLSILIAVFSGGWPYLKCLLMLFCWFMPRDVVPVKQQNRILLALDALGKWSLVDSYLLVAMMVAFRFTLFNPETSALMRILKS